MVRIIAACCIAESASGDICFAGFENPVKNRS